MEGMAQNTLLSQEVRKEAVPAKHPEDPASLSPFSPWTKTWSMANDLVTKLTQISIEDKKSTCNLNPH